MRRGISDKRFLTTGDIAEMCGVNYRTVIRWVEAGRLKAFQLPGGRGDRRVLPQDFVAFLRDNNMPLPEELLQQPARTVLVVEDEELMAKAIQRALRRAGFETMLATEGFLAGMLALVFRPTVITLDLKMPGLGGLAVLKAIRQREELVTTKVLVVSAMPREQLDEALAAGADGVLEKPFKNKDLVERVGALCEGEATSRPRAAAQG